MSKLLKHEKEYLKKLITHSPDKCEGRACCVHNPSDHHMRTWELNYRFDKGVMERICPEHGVGHPDPDDLAYNQSVSRDYVSIHGCCGCCYFEPTPPRRRLLNGLRNPFNLSYILRKIIKNLY